MQPQQQSKAPVNTTPPPGFIPPTKEAASDLRKPAGTQQTATPSTQSNDHERRGKPSEDAPGAGWHPLRSANRSNSPVQSESNSSVGSSGGNSTRGTPQQNWMQSPQNHVMSSPMSDRSGSQNGKTEENIWKAVGTPVQNRRSDMAANGGGIFPANGQSPQTSSLLSPQQTVTGMQQQPSQSPVYQFFGGRQHGQRSFSLAQPDDSLTEEWQQAVSSIPEEGSPEMRPRTRSKSVMLPGVGEVTPEVVQEMWKLLQLQAMQQGKDLNVLWEEAQRSAMKQSPAQPPVHMPEQASPPKNHRRASTFTNPLKQPNAWDRNSNIYHPTVSSSSPSASPLGPRHSIASSPSSTPIPVLDSQELASKYFNKDPSLMERRHSIAATMAINSEKMGTMALDGRVIPSDFAAQYGNLVESAVSERETTPSIPEEKEHDFEAAARAVQELQEDDSLRQRSWSEPAQMAAMKKKHQLGRANAKLYYVVEFKGGRNDYFYIPDGSDLQVKEGDLVIVEADRGKDLGKCILVQPSNVLTTPFTTDPKCIYRLAQSTEVNMLLDKARDEQKALAIVQAKARQKGLDMEIVDAEYQWDRRKLTFYFVAEERIDFRELVKDLFKIFKTRLWLCAIERSRTGVRLMH